MGDFEACRFDFRLDAKNGLTPSKRKKSERRGTCYNTLFKCKICGSLFDHRAALLEHKMLHSEFKCPICDLKVTRKVTLKEHISVIHGLGRSLVDRKVSQQAVAHQAAKLAELAAAGPSPSPCSTAPAVSELNTLPANTAPSPPNVITSPSTMQGYMCINIPLMMPPSGGQQDNTTVVSSVEGTSTAIGGENPTVTPVVSGSAANVLLSPQMIGQPPVFGQPPVSSLSGNQLPTMAAAAPTCTPMLSQPSTVTSGQVPTSLGFNQPLLPDMDDLEPGEIRPIYRNMFPGQIRGMAPMPVVSVATAASVAMASSCVQPSILSSSPSLATATVPVAAIQPTTRNNQLHHAPPPYRPETSNAATGLPVFVPNISVAANPPPPYSTMNVPIQPPPYTQHSGQSAVLDIPPSSGVMFKGFQQVEPMNAQHPLPKSDHPGSADKAHLPLNPFVSMNHQEPEKQDHLRLPVFIAASEPALSPPKNDDEHNIEPSVFTANTGSFDMEIPLDLSNSKEKSSPGNVLPERGSETLPTSTAASHDITSTMIVERIRAMERIARQEGFSNKWLLGKNPDAQGVPNIGSSNPFLSQTLPISTKELSQSRPSSQPSYVCDQIRPSSEPKQHLLPPRCAEQAISRSLVSSPILNDPTQEEKTGSADIHSFNRGVDIYSKAGTGSKKRPRTGLNSMVARLWQTKIQRNSVEKEIESLEDAEGNNADSGFKVEESLLITYGPHEGAQDPQKFESINTAGNNSPLTDVPSPSIFMSSNHTMEQLDSSVTQMDGAGDCNMESTKSLPDVCSSPNDTEIPKTSNVGDVLDLTYKGEEGESQVGKIWVPNPALEQVTPEWQEPKVSNKGRPRLEKMPIHRDPPRKRQKRDFYTVKFHTCKICRQLFDSAEKMWEHALQHEDFYKQKCNVAGCEFASLSKAELVKHRAEIHGESIPDPLANPDGKEYVCSYCGKALSSASSLYHHVTRHAHEKQYVCDYSGCTWRFFTSRELKLHIDKVHLGKKTTRRYSCPREGCTREFTMLDRLKRHLLSHAAKPQQMFSCPEPGCDRSFRYQRRLKVHLQEHSGLTPEKCVLCEFSCKQQATLTWHMKTKHGLGKLKVENVAFPGHPEQGGDIPNNRVFMVSVEGSPGNHVKEENATIDISAVMMNADHLGDKTQVIDIKPIIENEEEPMKVLPEPDLTSHSDLDHSDQEDLGLCLEGINKEAFYEALNLKLKSKVEAELAQQAEKGVSVAGQAFSTVDGCIDGNDQLATMKRWHWATFSETPVTTSVPLDQAASMSHFRWAPLDKAATLANCNFKDKPECPGGSMSHFRWATHDKATAMARNSNKDQPDRPLEGKLHCCKLCKQLFASSQKLWSHRLVEHDDVGQLFCDRCTYSTRRRQELEEHCLACHSCRPSSLKRIVCLTCGREYSSRHGLRQHQWKHHRNGNPEYPCPQDGCSLSFPSRAALKSHFQQSHPKPTRDLKCPADGCNKMFATSSALRSHQVLHLDQRPLVCDFPGCEKAFRESKHLKVHKMLHTDEKPLKCELCDYSCRQRNSLNWHMKSKHNLQKQVTADGRTIYV